MTDDVLRVRDEEAFRRAIRERPLDEDVRRAFRRWLEENGDPRSAVLREEERVASLIGPQQMLSILDVEECFGLHYDPAQLRSLAAVPFRDETLRACGEKTHRLFPSYPLTLRTMRPTWQKEGTLVWHPPERWPAGRAAEPRWVLLDPAMHGTAEKSYADQLTLLPPGWEAPSVPEVVCMLLLGSYAGKGVGGFGLIYHLRCREPWGEACHAAVRYVLGGPILGSSRVAPALLTVEPVRDDVRAGLWLPAALPPESADRP